MNSVGFEKRYRDPKTGLHISCKDGKNLIETVKYISVNMDLCFKQSGRRYRRFGLYFSLFHMGSNLPSQGLKWE